MAAKARIESREMRALEKISRTMILRMTKSFQQVDDGYHYRDSPRVVKGFEGAQLKELIAKPW
jgi:hypothetical protein